jgi:hypothetical protein
MSKGLTTNVKLTGEKELKRIIEELPKGPRKKALKAAAGAAAQPIVKAVRSLAASQINQRTGLLRKSVTKRVKSYADGNTIALIGASKSVTGSIGNAKVVPAAYWHLILGGVQPHAIGSGSKVKTGRQKGRIHPGFKGKNFLVEGFEMAKGQAGALAEAKMKAVIEKEVAKLASN